MGENTNFNENTRVKLPALVHLTRLGYIYYGKISESSADVIYDKETNILLKVFKQQFEKLNPEHVGEYEQVLHDIKQELDNDDLGHEFYKRLISVSPIRLIDFETPSNNVFHCTSEFTCERDGDEFRPDITIFVNGLPLVFVEVKKPNNTGGMIAEANRMNDIRFTNKKFRRFINITQLMIFSNNKEYDTLGGIVPVDGAFYCTADKDKAKFNCFREENRAEDAVAPFIRNYPYKNIDLNVEKRILTDFNCQVLHNAPEYQTNLQINTPTNRILTSMCSPERLLFLLKYGIAYIKEQKEVDGVFQTREEKHIMRYPQMFAALAVRDKIMNGVTSGVIWHTQGSGKTELAYYLNFVLTDCLAKQNKVTKFYFIVDRLDLMEQAQLAFEACGLNIKTANTRSELMKQFDNNQSLEGNSGNAEITVVNIQRFAEDKEKVILPPYATNLQRIFIVDEAHRGYNPKGSFLANLFDADKNSIKIALTGTPLLKKERASWKVFGDYYHTYYYDKSIEDGYTLKIMREDIETSYKEKLSEIYQKLETLVEKKDIKKNQIIEHDKYVKELLRYIITDLKKFRERYNDNTLGGMVICETSDQAKKIYDYFANVQDELNAENEKKSYFKTALILYDSDDKETRTKNILDFKKNMKIDILIVYNMLLTGFNAPRLKRLYFGRKLKDHNLLQALTRVNRPYNEMHYGFVVDFADIKRNFDETNKAYLQELNRFNLPDEIGDNVKSNTLTQVLESPDEIILQMKQVQQVLFEYTTDNLEVFSSEISAINDKEKLLELKKVLVSARDCCNMVRVFGDDNLKTSFAKLRIPKIPQMLSEVQHCIDSINLKQALYNNDSTAQMVFEAMQDIEFNFSKIGEEELKIASGGVELKEKMNRTIRMFQENIDNDDPEYISLYEAFRERFKEHGFVPADMAAYDECSKSLDEVMDKLAILQRKNSALLNKYDGDAKFARVHKRIREENMRRKVEHKKPLVDEYDETLRDFLTTIKREIDQKVYDRNDILRKDAYFEQTVMQQIQEGLRKLHFTSEKEDRKFIQERIAKQYLMQYNDTYSGI